MQDLTTKVQIALEAYLHWGRIAVASLSEKRFDDFFAAMARRDAAFATLHSLDGQAPLDAQLNPVLRDLWLQIDQVNRTLQGLMADLQDHLRQVLGGAPGLRLVRSA